MEWLLVPYSAAIIAGASFLCAALMIVFLAKRPKNPGFIAEGVAHALLCDRKSLYRSFRSLKYHLGGFTDDELRKILVRAGAIRLTAGGQEVWGLLPRNRKYLSVDDITETPAVEITAEPIAQPQSTQAEETKPQEGPDLSREPSEPFERLRAEMKKLGALECVRSNSGQG